MNDVKIKLAGLTIDIEGLEEIKKKLEETNKFYDEFKKNNLNSVSQNITKEELLNSTKSLLGKLSRQNKKTIDLFSELTPETIAASYARISRDPRPIGELRKDSRKDIEKARKSYSFINFGMGHKSIAEHVQLNFDIMNVTRRAVEEIEAKRLQGYTEKSQRYITLKGDFTIPGEIKNTPLEKKFLELIEKQIDFYNKNIEALTNWHFTQDYTENFKSLGCLGNKDKEDNTIFGYGKEDARYSLAQATQAQLGMTTSGRNLEVLISKLKSSKVLEFQEIGQKIFEEIKGIAPSVIKYTEPTDYFQKTRHELIEYVKELLHKKGQVFESIHTMYSKEDVNLFASLKRDDSIIAGLIFSSSGWSYHDSLAFSMQISDKEKIELRKQADKYQEQHDPKLREYELGDRVAEFIMSSSAFAQMKRHRMNTLIPQEYDVFLGHTVPESITQTNLSNQFKEIMNESDKTYLKMIDAGVPTEVADYALTNAHRRRILFDANNRQVHAFGAERLNLPAQWDIRHLAEQYVDLIKQESPITTQHVCGKDRFYETKEKF